MAPVLETLGGLGLLELVWALGLLHVVLLRNMPRAVSNDLLHVRKILVRVFVRLLLWVSLQDVNDFAAAESHAHDGVSKSERLPASGELAHLS